MKKTLSLLVVLALALSFAACGGDKEETETEAYVREHKAVLEKSFESTFGDSADVKVVGKGNEIIIEIKFNKLSEKDRASLEKAGEEGISEMLSPIVEEGKGKIPSLEKMTLKILDKDEKVIIEGFSKGK